MKKFKRIKFMSIIIALFLSIPLITSFNFKSKKLVAIKSVSNATESTQPDTITDVGNADTYEDMIKAFKEVAYGYYMRGTQIQYGSNKRSSSNRLSAFTPEDATSQNKKYTVCSGLAETVYLELLNIHIPRTTERLINYAKKYIDSSEHKEVIGFGGKNSNGVFEMKLREDNGTITAISSDKITIDKILPYLKPGDVITYTGHAIMVYDLIKENGIVKDAKIIESQATDETYSASKISEKVEINGKKEGSITHYLYYSRHNNNGFYEGSVTLSNIKKESSWSAIGDSKKRRDEYTILRFILKDENNKARLNYNGKDDYDEEYQNAYIKMNDQSRQRLDYSKAYIEKTVDVFNNSVVEEGDELTYTLTIANKSDANYTKDINVCENISNYVTYKEESNEITKPNTCYVSFSKSNDDGKVTKLNFNIGKLGKGEEIKIKYKVKVNKKTYGKTIESTGTVGIIPSSVVKNYVGENISSDQMSSIENAYNNLKNTYKGKALINKIYKTAFGENIDFDFNNFDITNLINKTSEESKASSISLNKNDPFYKSVLNNYWSCLRKLTYSTDSQGKPIYHYDLKNWRNYSNKERRADTIYDEHLKTGDILCYINYDDRKLKTNGTPEKVTNENGEYYYIFIEGKGFVGVNYGADNTKNTSDDRNEFNAAYYGSLPLYVNSTVTTFSNAFKAYINYQTLFGKDSYVILRPSIGFDLVPLELDVGYSTQDKTNKDVTVTITTNEKIQEVEGWELSENKTQLTKIYENNSEENLIVKDIAGHEKSVVISVTNIDKEKPVITAKNITYGEDLNIGLQDSQSGVVGWQLTNSQDEPSSGWKNLQQVEATTLILPRVNAGTYYIWAKDKVGNISSKKITVDIKDITTTDITKNLNETIFTYDGTEIQPKEVIKHGTTELIKSEDYTVEYKDNLNAGTGKVKITGKGNYKGDITLEFTINKKTIVIEWNNDTSFVYNGEYHCPTLVNTQIDGVNNEIIRLEVTGKEKDAGKNYTAIASISSVTGGQEKKENYKLIGADKAFEITPKPIVANVADYEDIYDEKEHGIMVESTEPTSDTTIYYKEGTEKLTSKNYETGSTENLVKKNAGEYTIQWYIHVANKNYSDISGSNTIVINKKKIEAPTASNKTYTGEKQTGVENGEWYRVEDGQKIDAGNFTAKAILQDKANTVWLDTNDAEDKSFEWSIAKKQVQIEWNNDTSFEYNGEYHCPTLVKTQIDGVNNEILSLEVTGQEKNAGTNHTATALISNVTGGQENKENYELIEADKGYTITPKPIVANKADYYGIYDEKAHVITVEPTEPTSDTTIYYKDGTEELTLNNYETGSTKNLEKKNAGEYIIQWYIHTTNKNYSDISGSNKIVINKKKIEIPTAINKTYNGKKQTGVEEEEGYRVEDGQQIDAGTYTAKAILEDKANTVWTDTNNTADKKIEWTIKKKTIQAEWNSKSSFTYNGKNQGPTLVNTQIYGANSEKVNLKVTGQKKNAGTNYTATASISSVTGGQKNNNNYKLIGNKMNFKIVPKGTSVSTVTETTNSITVQWKKQATHTTGYQVQYSTNNKFEAGNNTKTITINNNSTTSRKISSLKENKNYYVRIRTYKTINGTKYCSSWTKTTNVRTKSKNEEDVKKAVIDYLKKVYGKNAIEKVTFNNIKVYTKSEIQKTTALKAYKLGSNDIVFDVKYNIKTATKYQKKLAQASGAGVIKGDWVKNKVNSGILKYKSSKYSVTVFKAGF